MRILLLGIWVSCCIFAQSILTETNFPDANFRAFLISTFGELTTEDAALVESLDCANQGIVDMTGVSFFSGLTRLYFQENEVSQFDELETLVYLEVIYGWRNRLQNIDGIAELDDLRVLLICCNEIASLPFLGHLVKLESLVIYDNQLTALPGLPKPLRDLDIGGNPFGSFPDLSRLNLEELGIHDLGLTELPDLGNHTNMRSLSCENNQLTSLPDLSIFPELRSLGIWANQLRTLPDLSSLSNLRNVYACCNEIVTVPDFSGLTELRHLYLYDNVLTDIPSLAGLPNLERVYLNNNLLSNLEPIIQNANFGTESNHQLLVRNNALTSENCLQIQILANRFGVSGGLFEYQSDSGEIDCTSRPWIAHTTRAGGGFQSTLHFKNFSQTPAQVALTPYDAQGNAFDSVTVDVGALEHAALAATALFGALDVSHLSFLGSPECSVAVGYRLAEGQSATAHVNAVYLGQREFWIYPGEWDVIFDGLALVNVGAEPAVITGELYDATGQLVQSETLEDALPPRAKTLHVIGSVFPAVEGSVLRITSTTDAVATFLRGTAPGVQPGLLYQTIPLIK